MPAVRTSNYIATIPMKNEEQVIEVKKVLEQIFGWVTLRGRHSDRKSVVKGWSKSRQNDVPWRVAQYIDIYLHHANPNRMRIHNKQGMERKNLRLDSMSVIIARTLGSMGHSLSDGEKHKQQYKNLPSLAAIQTIKHNNLLNDPAYKRKQMKRKYHNKSYQLQPGDWGYITQSILDYAYLCNKTTFTQLKRHYDITLRGCKGLQKGGSFTHHLQALVKRDNAENRRCGRYLVKGIDGRYEIGYY